MKINKNNWEDYEGWSKFEIKNVLPTYLNEIVKDYHTKDKVISIGCGQGFPDILLQNEGIDLLGIDANKELLNKANKLGIETKLLDAYKIKEKLPAQIADIVIAPFLVHNTPNKRMQELYSNFYHLLKKGGKIIILDPNANYEHQFSTDRYTFRRVMDFEGNYLDSKKISPDKDAYMVEINLNKGLANETIILHQHKSNEEYESAIVRNRFKEQKRIDLGYQTTPEGIKFPAYQIWTARK